MFFPCDFALFCLTKVKVVCKWSEKFIILWLFFFSFLLCLKGNSFWEAGLDDSLNWEILVFNVSSQNVCMWAVTVGNLLLCHVAGYELVMCLGSPTDVPYWEKNSAGFNNCAFAMHGIQVSWKADSEIWVQGHLRKGQFKSTMPQMRQSSKMPNSYFLNI